MPPSKNSKKAVEILKGKVSAFNISPKGHPESFLLEAGKSTVQVNLPKHSHLDLNTLYKVGKSCTVTARPIEDHRPSDHPVYELAEEQNNQSKGVIARINYALHGEPNGIVLETGEFVHMKPEGARTLDLVPVETITFEGERKIGPQGQIVIEATAVNGKKLPKKH